MSSPAHKPQHPRIIPVLNFHLVRNQLVVQTRLREGVGQAHVAVEDVPEVLDGGGYDAGAAGGAEDQVEGVVGVFDDGGGDGGEGAGVGADVVGGGGDVAPFVAGFGDGEVWVGWGGRVSRDEVGLKWWKVGRGWHTVHFVVHDDTCFGNYEGGSEEEVDGGGVGDG